MSAGRSVPVADATRILVRASWVDNADALVFSALRTETHIQLFDRFWTRNTIAYQ